MLFCIETTKIQIASLWRIPETKYQLTIHYFRIEASGIQRSE